MPAGSSKDAESDLAALLLRLRPVDEVRLRVVPGHYLFIYFFLVFIVEKCVNKINSIFQYCFSNFLFVQT